MVRRIVSAAYLVLALLHLNESLLQKPIVRSFHHKKLLVVLNAASPSRSSSYAETGGGVKAIIQGLTSLTNLFVDSTVPARVYEKEYLTPIEVLNGVIGDFENGYLFSGNIDAQIYDEDCVFTDPTLSFKGLSTFERNIKALKPILDKFVGDTLVVLYDCQINEEDKTIRADWRMSGAIGAPWRPRIELTGNTVLTYDPDRGGRVVDYYESWDLTAAVALSQLLQPSKIKTERFMPEGIQNIKQDLISDKKSTETVNVKSLKSLIETVSLKQIPQTSFGAASIARAVRLGFELGLGLELGFG
jgi:hypothetical protein